MDDDALTFVFRGDCFLNHGVEIAQEGGMADEKMCFAAQVVEHAGHFDSYVACANQGYSLR